MKVQVNKNTPLHLDKNTNIH